MMTRDMAGPNPDYRRRPRPGKGDVKTALTLHSALGYLSPQQFEDRNPRPTVKSAP